MTELEVEGNQLEVEEEMRILGIIVRSDLKWTSNTKYIVEKGYSRLWMLRRLKKHGDGTYEHELHDQGHRFFLLDF